MLNLFIFSLLFSPPVENNINVVGQYVVGGSSGGFTPTAEMLQYADNETYLQFDFTPTNPIPNPLIFIRILDQHANILKTFGGASDTAWETTADTTTGRYEAGYKYSYKLPYNDTCDYFGFKIALGWATRQAVNMNFSNNLFTCTYHGNLSPNIEEELQTAYSNGKAAGIVEGKQEGLIEGYQRGKDEAYNNEWLKNCFRTLADILNIELFPGLSIGYIVALPLILALIGFIIGWFK